MQKKEDKKILDMVIVGAGAAGLTAAIYAIRARLDFVILEKGFPGGQIINTYEVENYPGINPISGFDLAGKFKSHLEDLGGHVKTEEVKSVSLEENIKVIKTGDNTYYSKTLIVATGASPRRLGLEGEKEFIGRGISNCATCDGAFYRDKTTLVVGGGDVAVEDAIYLARMCKKVYLIHRRDELRAVKSLQEKLFELDNVEILWFTEPKEIHTDEFVKAVTVFNNKTKEERKIEVDGVFIAVGYIPRTDIIKDLVDHDKGYIITGENCETSQPGIFAAGDLRAKMLRQIITACADGATAVFAAEKYL